MKFPSDGSFSTQNAHAQAAHGTLPWVIYLIYKWDPDLTDQIKNRNMPCIHSGDGPATPLKQGYLKLVAQYQVWMAFWISPWRETPNLPGQSETMVSHFYREKVFLHGQTGPSVIQVGPVASCCEVAENKSRNLISVTPMTYR